KINYLYGTSLGLFGLFVAYNCRGSFPDAVGVSLEYEKIAEKIKGNYPDVGVYFHYFLAILNREMGNNSTALVHFQNYIVLGKKAGLPLQQLFTAYSNLAPIYLKLKQRDSALWYAQM